MVSSVQEKYWEPAIIKGFHKWFYQSAESFDITSIAVAYYLPISFSLWCWLQPIFYPTFIFVPLRFFGLIKSFAKFLISNSKQHRMISGSVLTKPLRQALLSFRLFLLSWTRGYCLSSKSLGQISKVAVSTRLTLFLWSVLPCRVCLDSRWSFPMFGKMIVRYLYRIFHLIGRLCAIEFWQSRPSTSYVNLVHLIITLPRNVKIPNF